MAEVKSNTPYDDVFRTLYTDLDKPLIAFINEMFEEHYSEDAKIDRLANEHRSTDNTGGQERRFSDSVCSISDKNGAIGKYHCECESGYGDGTVTVRMFEYSAQIALEGSTADDHTLHVELPRSAILFLRCRNPIHRSYYIDMGTPGGRVKYAIPTLYVADYNIDKIFDKKLYMLIPFCIFTYEGALELYDGDSGKLSELIKIYDDIFHRLEGLLLTGEVDAYTYATLRRMTNKVVQNLANDYKRVRKGIGDIMGGRVLDYPEKDILNQGRAEGITEGQTLLVNVIKSLKSGATDEELAASGVDANTIANARACL